MEEIGVLQSWRLCVGATFKGALQGLFYHTLRGTVGVRLQENILHFPSCSDGGRALSYKITTLMTSL